jgi:2-dehydro-3-deoxy-D-arabinonate dehydratase
LNENGATVMQTGVLLYRTRDGLLAARADKAVRLDETDWDAVVNDTAVHRRLDDALRAGRAVDMTVPRTLLPPIGSQEVWAAGVTYYRSRDARMEESRDAGAASFYDRVYDAPRPELFLKAAAWRVVGPGAPIRVRGDSHWSVPEPELVLVVNAAGAIVGYTVGNDVSARDIEGENPLYLPQAKVYDGSCAVGPAVWISEAPPVDSTAIRLEITRAGDVVFADDTTVGNIKRPLEELVEYLRRETSFPTGCYLFTGTGIVPPDEFTLSSGDEVRITIDPIGTLTNVVA